ncbi:MAG: ATP-dependent helicase, partial [Lachnospiraceae bacterium]|nr:ATP-dependent helicase [Lachnospiraceae bacterium]
MNMNSEQQKAVLHYKGPCMVLAGPGSGKTTVITKRVSRLIDGCHVPPEKILVITFTRAAAEEMKSRYLLEKGITSTNVTFGTFHAVFFHILSVRYHCRRDSVAGESDRMQAIEEAVRKTDRTIGTDRSMLAGLLADISYVKNHAVEPAAYASKTPNIRFPELFRAYQEAMERRGKMDFDDMLLKTHELLKREPEVLSFWREQYGFLMIDEFQDINPVQFEIVKLIAAPENNLFIVGDDDQSIYGFRGASSDIMLGFPKAYPKTERILLNVNYRSRKEIVDASSKLIRHNEKRYEKALSSKKGRGGTLSVRSFPDDGAEIDFIVKTIRSELEQGLKPDDIAVLVRTHAGHAGILRKFMEHGIPFFVRDRPANLFENAVMKPVFSALNFASGNRTRKNFLQFMNCPYRYFRREDLAEEEVNLGELKKRYLADPERHYLADRVRFFEHQLNTLSMLKVPYAMVHYFRTGMGYDAYLKETASRSGTDPGERLKLLDEAQASARDFDTVEQWYRFIADY